MICSLLSLSPFSNLLVNVSYKYCAMTFSTTRGMLFIRKNVFICVHYCFPHALSSFMGKTSADDEGETTRL